jgi:hypothetical protein
MHAFKAPHSSNVLRTQVVTPVTPVREAMSAVLAARRNLEAAYEQGEADKVGEDRFEWALLALPWLLRATAWPDCLAAMLAGTQLEKQL